MKAFTDRDMEIVIGNLLRAGVILAAFTVLSGAVIYLSRHGGLPADYRLFKSEPVYLTNVEGILGNAFSLHGRGLIQLGLLLLVATPIARVALSIFAFARQRDWLYAIVTAIVFFILIYSLFGK